MTILWNIKTADSVLHQRPTLSDILDARQIIARHLRPTPLHKYAALDAATGLDLWVKHENHQPVGAFKVRGGINLVSRLSEDERRAGVVAASTGNHGQSVAYAARAFGVKATIVVPENSNPDKLRSMRLLGAEIIEHGAEYETCKQFAEAYAPEQGMRYISAGDEPLLVAGVGTYALEIFEDLPDADVIIAPVGGGSGACGNCIVARAVNPRVKVIGVQAEKAPSVYRSWKTGERVVTETADTFAEGLATLSPFDFPLGMLRDMLDDFVLVSEEEMKSAIRLLLKTTHNLAEGAGAAATAAAVKYADRWRDKKVVVILSGGNLSMGQLSEIMRSAK